jgi:hypothetical protein
VVDLFNSSETLDDSFTSLSEKKCIDGLQFLIPYIKQPTTNEMVPIASTYFEEQGIMDAICTLT